MGYFLIDVVAGAVWLLLYLLRKDLRHEIIVMSLIAAPFAALDLFFVPSYWKPTTFLSIPIGIEGILGSFAIGGVAAAIYPELFHEKLVRIKRYHKPISLVLLIGAIGLILFSKTLEFGNIMINLYILLLIGLAIIIYIRHDLAKSVILGGLLFGIVYFLSFIIIRSLYPALDTWYILDGLPKVFVARVPIYEILFAALYGAFWGNLYELFFGYRFSKKRS